VATVALMIGCIVGGYAWSSLRAVSAKEELRATMKAEFAEQFAALAARQAEKQAAAREAESGEGSAVVARHGESGASESLAQLPPCRIQAHPDEVGPVTCTENTVQTIALCAAVPAAASTAQVRIQARVPKSESPWQERDAGALALGSLRMAETPVEAPISADQRSVCLDVANWSVEDVLAVRMIVEYVYGPPPGHELTAAAPASATL
jgi:hypothetical protein